MGLVAFIGILSFPKKATKVTEESVGFLRKIASVFIDMFLVMIGFSALLAMPMLIAESIYVSEFFGHFIVSTFDQPIGFYYSTSIGLPG